MTQHHVVIGGGPAATNAVETIRQFEASPSRITIVCDEPPHSRMALPYWITGTIPREHTYTGDTSYFRQLNVETHFGARATRVDPSSQTVTLSNNASIPFDHLLIATGSRPQAVPIPGSDLAGVQPLWTIDHAESVLKAAEQREPLRVVLVGAGFIGLIVLGALFKRGWQLTVVERESQILPKMLDASGAAQVEAWLDHQSVAVHTNTGVTSIQQADDGAKIVELANGDQVIADLVILATGIMPNLDLIGDSGIATDKGILVNDRLQTNFETIYAAGDVAQGPILLEDRSAIHAVQPTAVDHGRVAGANMAGHEAHYPGSLLMNVVNVCGLQSASFGRWNDPDAETTVIENPAGFIYRKLLWQDDQLVGAILTGEANDLGMLTDVGMIKGLMQTETRLGPWKAYLAENPFDIRRAFVGAGVAAKLTNFTLLGHPTRGRQYQFRNAQPGPAVGSAHRIFTAAKPF